MDIKNPFYVNYEQTNNKKGMRKNLVKTKVDYYFSSLYHCLIHNKLFTQVLFTTYHKHFNTSSVKFLLVKFCCFFSSAR